MDSIKIRKVKNEKAISYKLPRGGIVSLVREVYLKSEISCKTNLCKNSFCIQQRDVRYIPADVERIVILDGTVALNYWELFESSVIPAVIVTLSSLNFVQQIGGRRHYNKIKKVLSDPAKYCVVFDNEYHLQCFQTQLPQECPEDYVSRQNIAATQWYNQHIDSPNVQIILLTENSNFVELVNECTMKITWFNLNDFLQKYHSNSDNILMLYKSLQMSQNTNTNEAIENKIENQEDNGYHPHELIISGISSGTLIRGTIQVAKYNSSIVATVALTEQHVKNIEQRSEILVLGQIHRNRAIHGDEVCVELFPNTQWCSKPQRIVDENEDNRNVNEEETSSDRNNLRVSPTGRVVGILSRNWRDYVCTLDEQQSDGNQRQGGGNVIVTPWDRRIPRIRMNFGMINSLRNQRFLVRIDDWPVDSQYPQGHFVQFLGAINDLETETKTLLHEYGLATREFTRAQLAELPLVSAEHPWAISTEELSKRRDLRTSHCIFSIDPINCKDVDDTLSIRRVPFKNGNDNEELLELGVHIADVTHFVKANSLLDLEARVRSTSVYLADRRIDMLPHLLSTDLCSLWSDTDRYAVSVFWLLTPQMEVKDVWFGRTIIRSKYKLHYELAQEIYENKWNSKELIGKIPELEKYCKAGQNLDVLVNELQLAIKNLVFVASKIQERRLQSGGLELDSIEVQVQFSDPDRKQMEDLLPKQDLQMHETIAECMIFANHYVAKRILQAFRNQSCLRNHPPPRQDFFDQLKLCASALQFDICTDTNKTLAESLNKAVVASDPQVNRLLRTMATQAMSNATYFSSGSISRDNFSHYGLALDLYTHFTSPIRRYADILVHRLLLAALELDVPSKINIFNSSSSQGDSIEAAGVHSQLLNNSALADQCKHMNDQHRRAQFVQRASVEMFQAMFFHTMPKDDQRRQNVAVIYSIRDNGFIVFISRFGIKAAVHLKQKDGSIAWIDNKTKQISWLPSPAGCRLNKQKDGVSIHVTNPNLPEKMQTQVYRVFDNVVVFLDVNESQSHGMQIKANLLSKSQSVFCAGEKTNASVANHAGGGGQVLSEKDLVNTVKEMQSGQKRTTSAMEVDHEDKLPTKNLKTIHQTESEYQFFLRFVGGCLP